MLSWPPKITNGEKLVLMSSYRCSLLSCQNFGFVIIGIHHHHHLSFYMPVPRAPLLELSNWPSWFANPTHAGVDLERNISYLVYFCYQYSFICLESPFHFVGRWRAENQCIKFFYAIMYVCTYIVGILWWLSQFVPIHVNFFISCFD